MKTKRDAKPLSNFPVKVLIKSHFSFFDPRWYFKILCVLIDQTFILNCPFRKYISLKKNKIIQTRINLTSTSYCWTCYIVCEDLLFSIVWDDLNSFEVL